MQLTKFHENRGDQSSYATATGGQVNMRLRCQYRSIGMLRMVSSLAGGLSIIAPRLEVNNNALLTMAFIVMRHWLETARRRGPHEEKDVYLAAMWRQGLEAMGIPPKRGQSKVTLTIQQLNRSEAMKKMRRDRR